MAQKSFSVDLLSSESITFLRICMYLYLYISICIFDAVIDDFAAKKSRPVQFCSVILKI